ncbi:MAG: tetratricopeptide repeat protein [Pyrinomonadaceae bacterium]
MRKFLFILLFLSAFISVRAQSNTDTVMILPFENTSGKAEFNWVGESFADSLSDLLKVPGLTVVTNEERKLIQQRLKVPLTTLPSLATSLKLARDGRATLLVAGKYDITPAQGDTAAGINITTKIVRVNEGRFLSEDLPDGKKVTRDINLIDALANLQTIEGQLAYQILYQRDKALPFSQNQFIEAANKVPAQAFEAYIKGLLTSETDLQSRENYFKNAMRIYAENEKTKDGVYADAALELGHFYLNQRKNQNAVEYFSKAGGEIQKCLEEAEKNHKTAQCSNAIYAEASFYTSLIYWQQKDYEQALAVLRPLADDLKLTSVYNTLGAIAIEAARAEKKNKGKSDALLKDGLDFLKQAAESAPDEAAPRFNYGLALFLNNDYKSAADQFRPILAMNPQDGESYYLLSKSLQKLDDPSAAEFDNQARRFLPNYAKVETDWQKTNTPDALNLRVQQPPRKDFQSVVLIRKQDNPQLSTPISETASLLAQAKDFYKAGRDDDAMQILRRIFASEPMSAQAYLLLGSIFLRHGDLDQAKDALKTALFWDNRLIDADIALGKIFLEKKDCLQAQNYSRLATELDAENEEAAALQRSVERCSK